MQTFTLIVSGVPHINFPILSRHPNLSRKPATKWSGQTPLVSGVPEAPSFFPWPLEEFIERDVEGQPRFLGPDFEADPHPAARTQKPSALALVPMIAFLFWIPLTLQPKGPFEELPKLRGAPCRVPFFFRAGQRTCWMATGTSSPSADFGFRTREAGWFGPQYPQCP